MGQYFRFINRDRQVESEIGLPFDFGMPWGKGLERLSTEELKKQFDFVIQANDWQPTDNIAIPIPMRYKSKPKTLMNRDF